MKKLLMFLSIILLSFIYINGNNVNASNKSQKVTQYTIIKLNHKLNSLREYIDNKDLNNETESHVESSIKDIKEYVNSYKNRNKLLNEIIQSIDNISGHSYGEFIIKNPQKFNTNYLTSDLKQIYIKNMKTYSINLNNEPINNKFSYKYWNKGYFNPSLFINSNFISFEGNQDLFKQKMKIPLYKNVKSLKKDIKQKNADANIGYLKNHFKNQIGTVNNKTIMVKKIKNNIFMIKYKNKIFYAPKKIISPIGNTTAFERYNTYIDNDGRVYSLYNIFNTKNVIVQNDADVNKSKSWFSAFQATYPYGTKVSKNGWKQNISNDA